MEISGRVISPFDSRNTAFARNAFWSLLVLPDIKDIRSPKDVNDRAVYVFRLKKKCKNFFFDKVKIISTLEVSWLRLFLLPLEEVQSFQSLKFQQCKKYYHSTRFFTLFFALRYFSLSKLSHFKQAAAV